MKNLVKRACFLPFILGLFFSITGFAQPWTEDFSGVGSGYGTGTKTLNGRTWTRKDAGNAGYGTSTMGSSTFTINDDKSGAHITTPSLNTCGTITFDYAYINGSSNNVFELQVSTDGSNFSTVDTRTLGASANLTFVSYSYSVNNASSTVYVRILSDNQNAHLFIDNFEVTAFAGPATPSVTFDNVTSTENESNATFSVNIPVTLSNFSSNVSLSVSVNGSSTAEGGDYTLNTTSLSFTGNGTQNISIDINDDADTDDETIILDIVESTATGITISTSQHTITITDDEVPPSGLQVSASNTAYTIDFDNTVSGVNSDAYAGTGLATSPSSGQLDADSWEIDGFSSGAQTFGNVGSNADLTRGTSTGGVSSGGLYGFNTGSSIALGVQPTGSDFTSGTIALRTQNATGASVTTWRVSYTIYVYNDEGRGNSWDLSYSTDNSSYTSVTNLDFTSTATADGSPAWKSYRHVVEFTQSVASAGDLYLRWSSGDDVGSGSRDEIAIDDIEVIADPSGNISLNGLTYDGYNIDNTTAEITSGTFTVAGNITNNGTINVSDGASLLQTTSTDNNSGSGTYNVSRNTGTLADNTRFQYWSSPMTASSMNSVFSGSNTSDMYWFREADQNWRTANGATMTPGRGYITTGTQSNVGSFSETRTFSGTINNGAVQLSIDSVAAGEYILVGNPYPSAISSTTFIADNSDIAGSIWIWDHQTAAVAGSNSASDYITWTGLGSAGGTVADNIGSCQGFFVEANTSSFNVSFDNGQRVAGNNTAFYKNGSDQRQRAWLSLVNDNGDYNQLLVGFVPLATGGKDRLYDGKKLKAHPRISFYSMLENEAYAIQGLPYIFPGETEHIPLGIDAWVTGDYTIALDSLDNWPQSYTAWVDDKNADTLVALADLPYTFHVDSIEAITDRFVLVVKHEMDESTGDKGLENPLNPGETTGIEDHEQSWFKAYRQQKDLVLTSSEVIERFTLYELTGRVVLEQEINTNAYRTSVQLNGVYLLRATSLDGTIHTIKLNF